MSNDLIQKNAELGRFLFCERYTLQPVKNALYIAEGQDLKRGAVVDVNGVLVGTNSLMPYAVLENDCDTRAKGAFASVFVKGEFNFDKLFFADGLSKNDLDNIVYNGSGIGLVINPYTYDEGFSSAMVPAGTSASNPLMNAEDVERMINAMKPIDAMTLRFEFSKKDYSPVTAGVGSAGTWTKVDSPTLNIWDWTNENTDWHESFKGAFPNEDNEVRVIAAGDTSNVTSIKKMFAGNFTGNVNGSNYSLTSRNNIVFCVPFNVSSCADFEGCFCGTCLKNVVKFHYDNTLESVQMFSLFADTYVTKADIDLYGAVAIISALFARCERLKFFSLKGCENVTKCVSCFYRCRPELKEIIINGELTNTTTIQTFAQFASNAAKIHIKAPKDNLDMQATFNGCNSLTDLFIEVGRPSKVDHLFANCRMLKEIPLIDTSNCSDFNQMMIACYNVEKIPNFDVSNATNVKQMCNNMFKAKYGIIEMYNKLLARGSAITNHTDCFKNCGIDTDEGRAALAQIPKSWGGLADG